MCCYLPVRKVLARLWAGVRLSHQPRTKSTSFPGSLILPLLPGNKVFQRYYGYEGGALEAILETKKSLTNFCS